MESVVSYFRPDVLRYFAGKTVWSLLYREDLHVLVVTSLIASSLLLVAIVATHLRLKSNSQWFRNEYGQHVKELPQNTRILRFIDGSGLSQAGKNLAGDDPYLVKNGPYKELVISTPEQMQEFLRKDYKDHVKAHNMNMGDYAGRVYGHCLGEQNGSHWKMMRGHFDPDFSHQAAHAQISTLDNQVNTWVEQLDRKIRAGQETKEQDVVSSCKMLAFQLISSILYGEVFDQELFTELMSLNKLYLSVVITALANPFTQYKWYNSLIPFTSSSRQLSTFMNAWRDFNLRVIEKARSQSLDCTAERIYSRGVRGQDGLRKTMTETEYLQTLIEILFANIDITGMVLASMLVNLGGSVDVQRKLRAEVRESVDDTQQVNGQEKTRSARLGEYLVKQNSLLHYVTLEAVRLVSHVHFSPPELTGAPKVISGFSIPPRTPVVIDVHRLNTHKSVWGPTALDFDPERFETMTPSQYRFGLMRWGIANGRCLGKNYADLVLKMIAAAVVQSFELKKVTGIEKSSAKPMQLSALVEFVPLERTSE